MEINILKNPNLNQIQAAFNTLSKQKINPIKLLDENLINNLSPLQFLFLIGLTSWEGKYFDKNFKFIKKFIKKIDKNNKNLLLTLENYLHNIFLKKHETEKSYLLFYSFFSEIYETEKRINIDVSDKCKDILFFVHSPVFLAHTNPLFYMLAKRNNNNIKIAVASLSENSLFTNELKKIGVDFHLIAGKDLYHQLENLFFLSTSFKTIIWQSVPVFLGYFSSIRSNVCLWSFKFHPKINSVYKNLSSFTNYNKTTFFNNSTWFNLDVGFDIKNINNKPSIWLDRKFKFGAFCREELINDENYWLTVKQILSTNNKMKFHYCGRKKIHDFWCAKLQINYNQIIFLGWLKEPHEKLKEMSFLLDGYKLGHGYLAYEAMAVGVPILFPSSRKSYGTLEMFIRKLASNSLLKLELKNYEKIFLTFKNSEEAKSISKKLSTDQKFNKKYGNYYIKMLLKYKTNTFEEFYKIIE